MLLSQGAAAAHQLLMESTPATETGAQRYLHREVCTRSLHEMFA